MPVVKTYDCSENKSYREADLRLGFCVCRLLVFQFSGSSGHVGFTGFQVAFNEKFGNNFQEKVGKNKNGKIKRNNSPPLHKGTMSLSIMKLNSYCESSDSKGRSVAVIPRGGQ